MWIIENNRLTNTKFTEDSTEKAIISPFPETLWRTENDRLTHGFLPDEIPEKAIEKPFPKSLWRIRDNLTHELLPTYTPLGAFENAEKLQKIIIPESVKKIGKFGFSGTALKTVKIASDCEYSESSFSENCTINFYVKE
ncbi:MAG: leucine-rich repeat domain-containing protein [Ruminococcus sp.]|nr:leucine-rich repeat domain-containing protein [Ruminococcus sp.]